jgi:hypothetical protein
MRERDYLPTWLLLMPSLAVGILVLGLEAPSSYSTAVASTPSNPPQSTLKRVDPIAVAKTDSKSAPPELWAARPAEAKAPSPKPANTQTRAKYEPDTGAYLGAAIDTSTLTDTLPLAPQVTQQMQNWNRESGRQHALQLGFVQFPYDDGTFPTWESDPRGWLTAKTFSDASVAAGATPIITLEPFGNPLQFSREWKADSAAYIATENFARSVGRWKQPIFIRFAHEMNGSWYPWAEWMDKNKNLKRDPGEETGFWPDDYKKAYRNVALLFRRYAPNAALVWCPNSGLLGGEKRDVFRPWYPGDDVVDWVGLDVYERGWTMPMPGTRPWAGQFAYNLTHDPADDPKTPWNESVNFYKIFVAEKNKPLMLCETSATVSYRTDLTVPQRSGLDNAWKAGYWNKNEFGWMHSVYGTSNYARQSGQALLYPIDQHFPRMKAIVWFQVAKRETIPVEKTVGTRKEIVWFDDAWTDYRVGGGVEEKGSRPFAGDEVSLYRRLTNSPYFRTRLQP